MKYLRYSGVEVYKKRGKMTVEVKGYLRYEDVNLDHVQTVLASEVRACR